MEWDFKIEDVYIGDVEYGLEDFLRDLKEEIDFNFKDMDARKKKRLCHVFYNIMHCSVIGLNKNKILEIFKLDDEGYKMMMDINKENAEMLQSIHMAMFLRNLKVSNGFVSDEDNFKLINGELRKFHIKHNL
jgi:hypothetical protein